jgi:hypothetical protein
MTELYPIVGFCGYGDMMISLMFNKSKAFFEQLNNSWILGDDLTPGT